MNIVTGLEVLKILKKPWYANKQFHGVSNVRLVLIKFKLEFFFVLIRGLAFFSGFMTEY